MGAKSGDGGTTLQSKLSLIFGLFKTNKIYLQPTFYSNIFRNINLNRPLTAIIMRLSPSKKWHYLFLISPLRLGDSGAGLGSLTKLWQMMFVEVCQGSSCWYFPTNCDLLSFNQLQQGVSRACPALAGQARALIQILLPASLQAGLTSHWWYQHLLSNIILNIHNLHGDNISDQQTQPWLTTRDVIILVWYQL